MARGTTKGYNGLQLRTPIDDWSKRWAVYVDEMQSQKIRILRVDLGNFFPDVPGDAADPYSDEHYWMGLTLAQRSIRPIVTCISFIRNLDAWKQIQADALSIPLGSVTLVQSWHNTAGDSIGAWFWEATGNPLLEAFLNACRAFRRGYVAGGGDPSAIIWQIENEPSGSGASYVQDADLSDWLDIVIPAVKSLGGTVCGPTWWGGSVANFQSSMDSISGSWIALCDWVAMHVYMGNGVREPVFAMDRIRERAAPILAKFSHLTMRELLVTEINFNGASAENQDAWMDELWRIAANRRNSPFYISRYTWMATDEDNGLIHGKVPYTSLENEPVPDLPTDPGTE